MQISRSAWCEWNRREPEREEKRQARERLSEEIRKIHEESGRVYGSPRILQALKGNGVECAKHQVERTMREEGIRAETKRKKIRTTDSRHGYSIVPNILNRNFESPEPNRKWVSDITYIATGEGWLYLAAIMDLASRNIVGWATSANIDAALVTKALDRAVANRKPPVGLILHSDRHRAVCELRIQESAMEERNHLFDEPEGELLGQCADGKLLRDIEDGMRSQEKLPDA